jgi:diacylglycerol O-acyltransferase
MDRLSPLSAAFLQAEDEDPTASMAIASVAVFAGPVPEYEEFVAHVQGRMPLVRRYRQRVRTVPFDLGAPVWVDDPGTDVRWHVRRTALPHPGGPDELHRLVARVMSQRMDRTRPLWEYWLVEGLGEGWPEEWGRGAWAVLQKVHHCVVDGVSGTALYQVVYDPGPRPGPAVPDDWDPQPAPGAVGLLAHSIAALVTTPVAGARALAPLLRQPRVLARRAGRALRGAVALGASVVPVAPTSLAGPLSRQRRFTSVTVPMADVRAVRAVLPGTVNDVALTSVAGGFRALLLARGERPDAHAVRTLVPVSARQPGEETIPDNRVSLLLVHLPVDVDDPVARLREVRRRVAAAGAAGEAEAGATLTSIAGVEPFLPVALGVRLAFHLPQRHLVTVTTNVPGPRLPVYALGRRCVRIIPYVPIADRVRVGVAVFSYADELVFGITADYDTVGDLDVLAGGVEDTFDALLATARTP